MKKYFLPSSFTYIGAGIAVASLLVVLIKGMLYRQSWDQTAGIRQVLAAGVMIGLSLMAVAKHKSEEQLVLRRQIAFVYAVTVPLLLIILELVSGSNFWYHNGYSLPIISLMIYLAILYLRSVKGNRKLNK